MTALVCLSGGIDSTVALCMARETEPCIAVGFDYGQPHRIELEKAANIATVLKIPFSVIELPSLVKTNDVVFAARNFIFAGRATAIALKEGCDSIVFGCNKTDWNRFPDCRPVFWNSVRSAIYDGYGIRVSTPLLHMTKSDIVRQLQHYAIPLDDTWSCYNPENGKECGVCLACEVKKGAVSDVHG